MPRSPRVYLTVPEDLTEKALRLADAAGHSLTPYLHACVISAVKAAEAGRAEAVPAALPRLRRSRREVAEAGTAKVAIVASAKERERWTTALEGQGSSLLAVVIAAMESFVEADGSWLDAAIPGEPGRVWRAAGAA